jgi:hypothetical protein
VRSILSVLMARLPKPELIRRWFYPSSAEDACRLAGGLLLAEVSR